MDALDLLKKDWKKENNKHFPKLTYEQIYSMLLKKSTSIVKWIFIISILEFLFWVIISFALKDTSYNKQFKNYHANNVMIPLMVVGYFILAYFFYKFYINYKNISVTDSAKNLMENILKTRKTVKNYVGFNLVYLCISFFIVMGIEFKNDKQLIALVENASANGELFKLYAGTILAIVVVLGLLLGLFALFYYVVYGFLLKKLTTNYSELKKLDF